MDPETAYEHQLHPAGHQRRPDRDDRGLQPHRRRHLRRRVAGPRRARRSPTARSPARSIPVARHQRPDRARRRTSSRAPAPRSSRSPGSSRPSPRIGEMGGFDAVALQKYHWVEKINHVHTPGNSSGIVDGAALMLIGSEQVGADLGLTPRARIVATGVVGTEPTIMLTGPAPSARKALAKAGLDLRRHRPVRDQRGVRRRRHEVHEGHRRAAREDQRQRRRDRARPPARRDRRDDPRHA